MKSIAPLFMAGAVLAAAPAFAQSYLEVPPPDSIRVLSPPPTEGSKAFAADKDAVRRAGKLEGQPRWDLAINDNKGAPQDALDDFACALGVRLDKSNAPTLLSVMDRMGDSAGPMIGPPKDLYQRKRPFLVGKRNICVPRVKALEESGSYPSGHTAMGWAWALVLAELAPGRATEILMRGRAYGESRVVCGVHYPSDIEAGRTVGAGLVAVLHASPAFRADLEKARAEIQAARQGTTAAPDEGKCAIEAEAGARQPW